MNSTGVDSARFLFRVEDMPGHLFSTGYRQPFSTLDESTGELLKTGLNYGPTEVATRSGGRGPAIWVEGRPDQLLHGRYHDELLPVGQLPKVDELMRERFTQLGVRVRGETEMSRVDTTVSVHLEDQAQMNATMRALNATSVKRRRQAAYFGQDGNIETLYYVGLKSKRLYERIYAEGPKHGESRKDYLRFEAQNRYGAKSRHSVKEWTADRAKETFDQRFHVHSERVGVVVVGGADEVAARLAQLATEGHLTGPQAMKLTGYLLFERLGTHKDLVHRNTLARYRAELRRLGVDLDETVMRWREGGDWAEPVSVDLGGLYNRVRNLSWA